MLAELFVGEDWKPENDRKITFPENHYNLLTHKQEYFTRYDSKVVKESPKLSNIADASTSVHTKHSALKTAQNRHAENRCHNRSGSNSAICSSQ